MRKPEHDDAIFRPRLPAPSPEAAKSLEDAWQKRRLELAGWQPSNGWLIESETTKTR